MSNKVGIAFEPKTVFIVKSANGVGKTSCTWNIIINIIYGNEKDEDGNCGPVNIFQTEIIDLSTGEKIDGFFSGPMYNGGFPK